MQNLALLDTETGLVQPYPRADDQPVEGLDSRYEVLRIVRAEQPECDPATHRLRETRTVNRDAGEWCWSWTVEPLPPRPDWRSFKRALLAHPAINELLGASLSDVPAAGLSLPATVLTAAGGGDVDDFRAAWVMLRRQGLISVELLQEVRALAISLHLPEAFVAALGGSTRPVAVSLGQEWVDNIGELWVVVQARDASGQFVADDPTTPIRESLAWEKA
jgi:hypothetical protein